MAVNQIVYFLYKSGNRLPFCWGGGGHRFGESAMAHNRLIYCLPLGCLQHFLCFISSELEATAVAGVIYSFVCPVLSVATNRLIYGRSKWTGIMQLQKRRWVDGEGTNPAIKNDLLLKFPAQSQRSGNKRKCADSAAQSAHRQ